MSTKKINHSDEFSIMEKVRLIKRLGFGEVRILIKNGVVYRILVTEDRIMDFKE